MFKTLSIRGLRCFRDRQVIDLGRFALVYGRNNSGKSALLRTLPWLRDSRLGERPGTDTASPALNGAGWREIRWYGTPSTRTSPPPLAGDEGEDIEDIELGVVDGAGRAWVWGIDQRQGEREPTISRFATSSGGETVTLKREPALSPASLRYLTPQGATKATFNGMLPKDFEGVTSPSWLQLLEDLRAIQWVAATRQGPDRRGHTRGTRGALSSSGSGIAELLASDARLLASVSRWYERASGIAVEVQPLGNDMERIVARSIREAGSQIPFPDIGEGLQHALPVITHLAALRQHGGTLVVEEPEVHLHPGLQVALAQEICDTLVANPQAQVLVETHSEVFLLSALSATLGALPGDVRLLWVDADPDGAAQVESIGIVDGRPQTDRLIRAFEDMKSLREGLALARGRLHAR